MRTSLSQFFVCAASGLIVLVSCKNEKPQTTETPSEQVNAGAAPEAVPYGVDTISFIGPAAEAVEDRANTLSNAIKDAVPSFKEGDETFYIVEGDIRMDADDIQKYSVSKLQNSNKSIKKKQTDRFTVATDKNGRWLIWPANYKIKYCVLKKSFRDTRNYQLVVENMKRACKDWMDVANVTFEYVPSYDNRPASSLAPADLTFVVREFDASGEYLAMAFFPNDPLYKRKIFIDLSYYNEKKFDKVGILRHELGHVLGARHEHIWSKEADCAGEQVIEDNVGATPLTDYDPYSVMHYLCGGAGDSMLTIKPFDIQGMQALYGAPKPSVAKNKKPR